MKVYNDFQNGRRRSGMNIKEIVELFWQAKGNFGMGIQFLTSILR